jgi:hypothetical protein
MIVDELKDTLYIENGIICRNPLAPDVPKKKCKDELYRIIRINEKNQSIDFERDLIFYVSLYTTREMKCICSTKIENIYYIQNKDSGNRYAIGCVCVENNFNEELGKVGKSLKSDYRKKKKSMKKEWDELTDYLSRLKENRNKVENDDKINRLDESTESKKRELQIAKQRIINKIENFEFFMEKKKFSKFISESGINYIRTYYSTRDLPWYIFGEISYFIRYSSCKTIKDFVENELIEYEFQHPICNCRQKKDKKFKENLSRFVYRCPNQPNWCKKIPPEYGFLCDDDKKPLLESIQEKINKDIEHRNELIDTKDRELKKIDRTIEKTNLEINELDKKMKEFTFIES